MNIDYVTSKSEIDRLCLDFDKHFYFYGITIQPEIIIYRGYPVELHTVLTEDGYLLGIILRYFSFRYLRPSEIDFRTHEFRIENDIVCLVRLIFFFGFVFHLPISSSNDVETKQEILFRSNGLVPTFTLKTCFLNYSTKASIEFRTEGRRYPDKRDPSDPSFCSTDFLIVMLIGLSIRLIELWVISFSAFSESIIIIIFTC